MSIADGADLRGVEGAAAGVEVLPETRLQPGGAGSLLYPCALLGLCMPGAPVRRWGLQGAQMGQEPREGRALPTVTQHRGKASGPGFS